MATRRSGNKKAPGLIGLILALLVGVGIISPQTRDLVVSFFGGTPSQASRPGTAAGNEPSLARLPNTPGSFETAKKRLYEKVYAGHRQTFYCGCDYNAQKQINLSSCGVVPRQNAERAASVEAEHVFPAAQFGNFRECWREPKKVCPRPDASKSYTGRECCLREDELFKRAHNDLHNLYPAVGEINGDRRDYNWGMIPGNTREYGRCAIEIDSGLRRAEPPDGVKGDIARTMFYMSHTYGFRLSDQDIQLFNAWSKQDPADAWEQERNRRIAAIQGNRNPFVDGAVYDARKIGAGKS